MLPRHARFVLSRLRCNGCSLLLCSYLSRIGRIENPSWSACGHSSQDTSHLILHCPATDSLRRSLYGDSLSLYDFWSRPWGVARFLRLHGFPPCPYLKRGRVNKNNNNNIRMRNRIFRFNKPKTRKRERLLVVEKEMRVALSNGAPQH